MRSTRKTSSTALKTCLAVALTAATGSALALSGGGIVSVADDYSATAPARAAPPPSGRMEGDRDAQPPATTSISTGKAEEAVSDSAITSQVKTKLLFTIKDLNTISGIHIKTRDGIVKVSGSVPSKAQHDIALETIRSVDGVRSIHDSLKVASR